MSAFTDELLAAERAKTQDYEAKIAALHFLIGYYGVEADRSRSAGFKALVEKVSGVLDGTLDGDTIKAALSFRAIRRLIPELSTEGRNAGRCSDCTWSTSSTEDEAVHEAFRTHVCETPAGVR